jgi:glycosyltransferase involved in cell wall biosynthesis
VIHDVDAYRALAGGEPPAAGPEPEGLDVVGLRSGLGALSPLLTQQTGHPVVNGGKIRRLLERLQPAVLVYHNISLVGGPGLLSYGRGIKIYMAHEHWLVCPTHVLWRHGRERCTGRQCFRCQVHYRRPPQWWRWTGLLERQLAEVDAFVAMSEFSRQKHREFGFPRDMEVLPYFLPEAATESAGEAAAPHPRPYFLFVGRLEEIKGVQDLLPTFRGPGEVDLVIAGEGEYGPALRAAAAGSPRVRFLGRVPGPELATWYRHAIALLVPSLCFETFGIILLEAWRQRTPVIARRLGPFPELVEQAGGGEVFETTVELEAAMTRLRRDPVHREALARAGEAAVERYWSEHAVVPAFLELVRRAAERRQDRHVLGSLTGGVPA